MFATKEPVVIRTKQGCGTAATNMQLRHITEFAGEAASCSHATNLLLDQAFRRVAFLDLCIDT
jgi:hypothetical protein